jgi:hypothetical protein
MSCCCCAIQVARGKTDYCAAHGGGVRCKAKGCYKIAVGTTNLCRMHGTAHMQQTAMAASAGTGSSSSGANHTGAGHSSGLSHLAAESERAARAGHPVSGADSSDESDLDEAQVLYGRSAK